ncbi:MAG: glycosyltransferase, partial [Rhodoglobus sp.]|nr:glycosyltransferase [Rhodoglobus sp.]
MPSDDAQQTRVLVLTGDPIGKKMAGPAIRAWAIASILSVEHDVTLATTTNLEKIPSPFNLIRVRPGEQAAFAELEAWADVIIFQGHAMSAFPLLQSTSKIVVVDIYDPMHLEQLEQGRELPRGTWELNVQTATRTLNQQLALGDFFLCASERQRPFYLGQLAALGRINPANYENDPDLEGLLAVAPFGLAEEPPFHSQAVLKGVRNGFAVDDKVLIWGGGLYNWFDPQTLIRAVARVSEKHANVRLFFLGTKHPGVDEMAIVGESRELARELGVLDRSVFFNQTWVEFAERGSYLLEADAGVSTHHLHIETRFSFRTRILDYLWAGLPIVASEGDGFADLIIAENLGEVVKAGDIDGLTAAIEKVLFDADFAALTRRNVERLRDQFTWSNTLDPLVRFMRDPRHAPDRASPRGGHVGGPGEPSLRALPNHGLRHDLRMTVHHLKHAGIGAVARKLWTRLR